MNTETAATVKRIIAEHLAIDIERVTDDANIIYDLGADSLDVVELTMEAEDELFVEIPDHVVEHVRTVADAVRAVEEAIAMQEAAK